MPGTIETVQPGCVRLVHLQTEGRLSRGDQVETSRLGVCEVAWIDSVHAITVKNPAGALFRIDGISFGSNTRMETSA